MFDSKQTLTDRLAGAMDLAIDFATLGEYGLEPVGRAHRPCEADRLVRGASHQAPTTTTRTAGAPAPGAWARAITQLGESVENRGPRPAGARKRGARGASRAFSATGVA